MSSTSRRHLRHTGTRSHLRPRIAMPDARLHLFHQWGVSDHKSSVGRPTELGAEAERLGLAGWGGAASAVTVRSGSCVSPRRQRVPVSLSLLFRAVVLRPRGAARCCLLPPAHIVAMVPWAGSGRRGSSPPNTRRNIVPAVPAVPPHASATEHHGTTPTKLGLAQD